MATLLSNPVHWLEIERRFTAAAGTPAGRAVIGRVVELARTLGIATVAEGIEPPAQLEAARDLGVTFGQGLLLGSPQRCPAQRTGHEQPV